MTRSQTHTGLSTKVLTTSPATSRMTSTSDIRVSVACKGAGFEFAAGEDVVFRILGGHVLKN